MSNEFFPPNEEELEQMIREITDKMDEAESQAEWDQLNYERSELQEKLRQLIIKNNALWAI